MKKHDFMLFLIVGSTKSKNFLKPWVTDFPFCAKKCGMRLKNLPEECGMRLKNHPSNAEHD
jgi:hypothetical protein